MSNILVYSKYNNEYIIGDMSNTLMNGFVSGAAIPNKLIIPFSIDGKEIKAIGSVAFYRCLEITECLVKAKIHTIHGAAFFGCQNLHRINIPSTVTKLSASALDGRIDQSLSQGPLAVYFEPGTQLKNIENAGISNYRIVKVYIYDKVYPTTSTYMFGGATKLTIYSQHSYKFCGFQTTVASFLFQTNNVKNRSFSVIVSIMPLLLISR